MSYLLDVLGSFAIGSLVLLMLFRFNQTMLNASNEKLIYNITQLHTVVASEVIEYDFYKIGYRVDTSAVFLACEEDGVTYLSDFDNDGTIDTVEYSLGTIEELQATENPYDMMLYRTVNGGNPEVVTTVVDFELEYRDTNGVKITPISDLLIESNREAVRGIDVYIHLQSTDKVDGMYQGTEWKRNLSLKNLY